MRHVTSFEITEPTTVEDGAWHLAKFRWHRQLFIGMREFEGMDLQEVGGVVITALTDFRCAFDDWLERLPKVHRWHQQYTITDERLLMRDGRRMSATASGWFELSDDKDKTAYMLDRVNCDDIQQVPHLKLVESFPPPVWIDEAVLISPLLDDLARYEQDNVRPGFISNRALVRRGGGMLVEWSQPGDPNHWGHPDPREEPAGPAPRDPA